jgi:hypothetical protein
MICFCIQIEARDLFCVLYKLQDALCTQSGTVVGSLNRIPFWDRGKKVPLTALSRNNDTAAFFLARIPKRENQNGHASFLPFPSFQPISRFP